MRPTHTASAATGRAPHKAPGLDLRPTYRTTLEIGFIVALGCLILLVRAPLRPTAAFEIAVAEQEVVTMEEVRQTRQDLPPPPPPRPQVLAVVSDDVILDDVVLDLDATLDLDAPVAALPPPPPAPAPEAEAVEAEPEVFVIVEQPPVLIGGIAGLQAKVVYPEIARRAGVEGRVVVQFVIDETGRVLDPHVVRAIGGGCDEEALRVVSEARFEPGRQRGRTVRVQYAIPVSFRLRGDAL